MIIVETERRNLKSMKDTEHLNYSINQHMKKIKEHSDCKKIMQLFQLIAEHSVKHAGMSFMRNKTMAKKLKVSVRTIQRYTKLLEELLILLKIPTNRKNNRGQASNTYVILPVIKSVVSRVCHGVCHPLNPSFKPLKQENNNYINNQSIEVQSDQKESLMRYAEYKINDIIKKGVTVEYASSYINKLFKSLERQSLYYANELDKKRRKRQQQPLPIKRELPFYNWLEQ